MKQCPNCQTIYSDVTLQFCLQDGTPLSEFSDRNAPINSDTEAETIVSTNKGINNLPRQVEPIRFEPPSSYQTNQSDWSQPPSQPVIIEQPRETKKSNTTAIVLLTALGTLLLLGIGGAAAWMYFKNNRTEVAVNVNTAQQNRQTNANTAIQNVNVATPSPTPSPTPQPTLKPEAAKAVTNDVKNVVDEWKDTTENLDLDAHVSQYADTVDYYKAGRVNISKVRDDRARAFAAYDIININIDNVKVTPDASGEKATVILDKEWNFEGAEKFSSGKVQQQLTLAKTNGKWLITGEKDLKIYYVNQ